MGWKYESKQKFFLLRTLKDVRFSCIRWPVSKLSRLCNKECLRGPGKMIGRFRWIVRWNEVDLFVDFNLYFCIESVPELINTCISISRTFCTYSCFRNCEFSWTVNGNFFPATVTFQISVHYGQMIFLYRTPESILGTHIHKCTHTHNHWTQCFLNLAVIY